MAMFFIPRGVLLIIASVTSKSFDLYYFKYCSFKIFLNFKYDLIHDLYLSVFLNFQM